MMPLCLLLKQSFRQSRGALRLIGSLILLGIFLHVVWLIAPVSEAVRLSRPRAPRSRSSASASVFSIALRSD